ncbi:hypothetical protein KAR91_09650 [Candidatus Pacearchaeota archaeon]|nr:hypothetical protein [Candidatus Pacearchaeota archaeon]
MANYNTMKLTGTIFRIVFASCVAIPTIWWGKHFGGNVLLTVHIAALAFAVFVDASYRMGIVIGVFAGFAGYFVSAMGLSHDVPRIFFSAIWREFPGNPMYFASAALMGGIVGIMVEKSARKIRDHT